MFISLLERERGKGRRRESESGRMGMRVKERNSSSNTKPSHVDHISIRTEPVASDGDGLGRIVAQIHCSNGDETVV